MKDPAFLFYSSDFITGTLLMTDEQVGKYIKLLCLQHQRGKLDEKHMLNICKRYDEDIFEKFARDDKGLYYNERLDNEINRRSKYCESRRNNRTKEKTYVQHMETETETITINNTIKEKESEKKPLNIPFDNFWNLYDKKVDRKKCEIKWVRLNDNERKECIDKVPAYVFSTPDKKFRRDPETYLNNKSWENEIISPVATKIELPKTYEEMLELTKNNPELWKQYKAVKKEGERKATYIPIS